MLGAKRGAITWDAITKIGGNKISHVNRSGFVCLEIFWKTVEESSTEHQQPGVFLYSNYEETLLLRAVWGAGRSTRVLQLHFRMNSIKRDDAQRCGGQQRRGTVRSDQGST